MCAVCRPLATAAGVQERRCRSAHLPIHFFRKAVAVPRCQASQAHGEAADAFGELTHSACTSVPAPTPNGPTCSMRRKPSAASQKMDDQPQQAVKPRMQDLGWVGDRDGDGVGGGASG